MPRSLPSALLALALSLPLVSAPRAAETPTYRTPPKEIGRAHV